MRVLFTADWHIKIGQRKVPKEWQTNRFHLLVDELNKVSCDLLVIAGDIFDKAEASLEEIEFYFELIAKLVHKTIIFSGNHEAKTKTYGILHNLAEETSRCNPLVTVVTDAYRSDAFDIVDFYELHKPKWEPRKSNTLFTHVRAALPEHMKQKPEIDLSKFDGYDIVFAGDLHSHKMSQQTFAGTPIIYPGSPLTTSFHRKPAEGDNGYIILDTDTGDWTWHSLEYLPQLIRKTVSRVEDMEEDPYNRVIYELEGDLSSLGKVKASDLLDKKINTKVSKEATLQLKDLSVDQELAVYLGEVENLTEDTVVRLVTRFRDAVSIT